MLFHHRWAIPLIAELERRQGERFAVLARRFALSRESLSQTLAYLVDRGFVRRNPGYGHPLRPEYILTASGERIAPACIRLSEQLKRELLEDLGLRKWPLPIVHFISSQGRAVRFGEVLNAYDAITPRALSDALKRLEDAGLLQRVVTEEFPPATRYSLTAMSKRYAMVLGELERLLK